jgi:anti-sigma factor RsiW
LNDDFVDRLDGVLIRKSEADTPVCQKITPLLDALHDHELSPSEHAEVSAHVGKCEKCTHALADIGRLAISLKALGTLAPKRDFADEFESILAKRKKVVPFGRPILWVTAGIAAGFSLLLFAMHWLSPTAPNLVASSSSQIKSPSVLSAKTNEPVPRIAQLPLATAGSLEDAHDIDQSVRPNEIKPREGKTSSALVVSPKQSAAVIRHSELDAKATAHATPRPIQHANGAQIALAPQAIGTSVSQSMINKVGSADVVALYDNESSIGEELGMSTDEDGLYAIKL